MLIVVIFLCGPAISWYLYSRTREMFAKFGSASDRVNPITEPFYVFPDYKKPF